VARPLTAVLITEPAGPREAVLQVVARALHGGIDAVIVRRPRETAREVFELARRLRPGTRRLGCLLLVSDRADVAVAADADGVHLGARSLPVAAARRVVGAQRHIGVSTHNLDQAGQAEEEGADYVVLGPVFPTASHPGAVPLPLVALREASLRARVPVLGLGGIVPANVADVARAGATGAAAITAFSGAADPAETARAFRAAFAR